MHIKIMSVIAESVDGMEVVWYIKINLILLIVDLHIVLIVLQ